MKKNDYLALHRRSKEAIAHGACTNSKRAENHILGIAPSVASRGFGCFLYDTNGNKFVDYICALGTNLVGYGNATVAEAVYRQYQRGASLSLTSIEEVAFAERLKNYIPFAERFRFLKTGTEACMAAVKIARTYTNNDIVMSHGYHGWSDDFVSLTPPSNGVPERPWMETLSDTPNFKGVAAVIIEPVITDYSAARITYLQKLREATQKAGVVLIFDETITGLRFDGLSFAAYSGISPDILVMGKALGGGMPLSIITGKKDLMECDYFVSSSFAGDLTAIAGANAVLDILQREYTLETLWTQAAIFVAQFNQVFEKDVWIEGYPLRGVIKAKDDKTFAIFLQETVKAGLLFGPSFFWCAGHENETYNTIKLLSAIHEKMIHSDVRLEGEMPQKPFAQKVRET